jgi:hypothetical protein
MLLSAFVVIVDKRLTSRLQKTAQVPEIREDLAFARVRSALLTGIPISL